MKELLEELSRLIDLRIEKLSSSSEHPDYLERLAGGLQVICEKIIHIGSYVEEETIDKLEYTIIQYEWLKEAKDFVILWRDTCFEHYKAFFLHAKSKTNDAAIQTLKEESVQLLEKASEEFEQFFEVRKAGLSGKKEQSNYLEEWGKIISPWEVYREQLTTMSSQGHTMVDQYNKLVDTSERLEELKGLLHNSITHIKDDIQRITSLGQDTISNIEENIDYTPEKVVRKVNDIESQLSIIKHVNNFKFSADQLFEDMVQDVQVPISLIDRQIVFKEVNFSKSIQQWLTGEIQPILIEAQEIADGIGNSMRVALVNVKNRIQLKLNDKSDQSMKDVDVRRITSPLRSITESVNRDTPKLLELENILNEKIESNLDLLEVFDTDEEFLELSQQYRIGQIKIDSQPWIESVKNYFSIGVNNAKKFFADVAEEESLSDAEKIVRYIESRKSQEENNLYTNIFSTDGQIGDTFWVGRKNKLSRCLQIIRNWKQGYRGSVLISGMRHSGKSDFCEVIAHKYFPNNTIRINPGQALTINNKSIERGYNLREALDFTKNRNTHERALIIIDDLELWQNVNISISENLRALINHIDTASPQFFFMVTMSNWFKHHFAEIFFLNKVFQAEINLDNISEEEVRQAIMLRHGATHKVLVDEEGEKINATDFTRMAKRVFTASKGNIGDALNLWSYLIRKGVHDTVVYKALPPHHLPDFLNDENSVVLKTILLNKRTNEYRLLKILGSTFKVKYKAIIQRLISLGILTRTINDDLEINHNVVNEVAHLLDKAKYIKSK